MADKPSDPGPKLASAHPTTGVEDTVGGYLSVHQRPPAFQGSDGHPYTVSLEVEKTPNLHAPFAAYLVFPRWAESGVGIVGHLETPLLLQETTREKAEEALGALTLLEVKEHLENAIQHRAHETD
jgi:hypothetical protein